MLEYIEHKLKESGQNNQIVKYIMKCLKCCFWCLEKFLKFLNKNAYIEIAIYGKNFCVSAKNAFFLLMRNVVRVVVLDKVTDFLLFIGKVTITLAMAVGSFYWFERDKNLNYFLAPVIIITVATYVIATAFFSVYEMAIDTLFLCFLEDLERNDGSEEKPYYMSKKLKKILGKKNKRNSDSE
ncbi:choline transporter 4 [Paramuricea clavata]|uniref:Choline transporter-like protein n=1 Tax=Paramuricea clavata TaxID=317549 RepID=A0A7D9LS05_PARCT|nr:choline transporter 4 [Paramuricea clavata]